MTGGLALSGPEEATIRAILRQHLPAGTQVMVFGSRAGGACKPWSDLDLALDAGELLPLALLAELAEAFAESPLPWKVDLLDLNAVSDEFRAKVIASALSF